MFDRYAIYYTPQGALADAGASWLGWDIAGGHAVAHPQLAGLDAAELTRTPRKYGFHATIKPPFGLAESSDATRLGDDLTRLCAQLAPVRLDGLDIRAMGRFLALTPLGDQSALAAMAAGVVRALDAHRARPTKDDLARRRARPLSPAQERNLLAWGYPYVMDQFRFHITLTGPVKTDPQGVAKALHGYFAPYLPRPCLIDSLTLAGQDTQGMFHEITRVPLTA